MKELQHILNCLKDDRPAALVTVVRTSGSTPRRAGAKMIVREDGQAFGTICGGCIEAEAYAEAKEVLRDGSHRLRTYHLTTEMAEEFGMKCGGSMEIFIEPLTPSALFSSEA